MKETIVSAKTVELAVEKGAAELGCTVDKVIYEVLEQPKRGILGIGGSNAKLRVFREETPGEKACAFVQKLLADMELPAETELTEEEDSALISVSGEDLGLLIGKHGDVLDSVQYLATIAANKGRKDFFRIAVDVEGYREKRAEALRRFARRTAERVLKSGRSCTLEPMNAYERRIVHSEVQNISGVTTYSVGQDNDRKIVVCLEGAANTGKK